MRTLLIWLVLHSTIRWMTAGVLWLAALALPPRHVNGDVATASAGAVVPAAAAEQRECHSTPRGRSKLPAQPGYERDHIVPLCLGGADTLGNMQYQPWDEARAKDRLEAHVCHLVCDLHRMSVEEAQTRFRNDWRALYLDVFGAAATP
jgi:hypothetical protein